MLELSSNTMTKWASRFLNGLKQNLCRYSPYYPPQPHPLSSPGREQGFISTQQVTYLNIQANS